jgi:hypothetical protein
MGKTVIDLGAYDETYVKYFNGDKLIQIDLFDERDMYSNKRKELKKLYLRKRDDIAGKLEIRIKEILGIGWGNIYRKKEVETEIIDQDVLTYLQALPNNSIDEFHASYLFNPYNGKDQAFYGFEEPLKVIRQVEKKLKLDGIFSIVEFPSVINFLVENVANDNSYEFSIEEKENMILPETLFQAIYFLDDSRSIPQKLILRKMKENSS